MYSAYKLNRQSDNIQPWCTPFPIWNQSVIPCPVLTVASWPAYRFLRRQVKWPGIPISWRIFHFAVIHTIKGFGTVNKAEVDVFWNSLTFSMIQWMLAIWSLVPLPFQNPAWTSGSSWFTYCWNLAWRWIELPNQRGKRELLFPMVSPFQDWVSHSTRDTECLITTTEQAWDLDSL